MNDIIYRIAPPGFTRQQWRIFAQEGFLHLENVLTEAEVEEYLRAVDQVVQSRADHKPGEFLELNHLFERHPLFARLLDHPRHVGFAYDLYGEQLKVHHSQLFVRPPGQGRSQIWHPDGPRAVPYHVFSPHLPLQVKIGYWLTDLPRAKMGNLVVLPGSHRHEYMDAYDSTKPVAGERVICLRKGDLTIMQGSLWHRVEPNESTQTRKNLYITYCPSWITASEQPPSEPSWLETLNREQRIILRNYPQPYEYAKPPAEDFPLFLDRESAGDRDVGVYPERIKLHRRKRKTTIEKWTSEE